MCKSLLSLLILFFAAQLAISQPCNLIAVNANALACDGNYFMVSVDLQVDNPASPGFTLAGNGVIYGTYLYSDLPVTVGPFLGDDQSVYSFIAWDVEDPACQNFDTIPPVNCGPICNFSNPELVLVECVSLLSALVTFDFDYENVTNPAFDLFYENGSEVGSYLYQSLPITIPFFVVNGAAPITLTICDNNNLECCETFSFDAIDCDTNNCEIVNLVADPQCIGNNFIVHLNFDYAGPISDSFTVQGNSLNYGTFAYSELPLTLGPLNGASNIVWEFLVQDVGNPDCQEADVLGVYHCPPPCNIEAVIADVVACSSDSTYALQLGVEIEGEGDLGFSVISNNYYYGTFQYDNLPIVLDTYEGSGGLVDQVTVCDNDNPGCCSVVLYEAFLCAGCVIADLVAIPQVCEDDSLMVELDFYFYNTSSTFEVSGNGGSLGTYFYDDLPVLIGPFPGDGSVFLEFLVTDSEDPFCFAALEVGELTCDEICALTNLVVETGDCTGDDTYVAHIDFDYQGVTGIGFDLFVNGEFYDFYSYDDLPLTIEEFPSTGTGIDMVQVCENDNPLCCATLEFVAPDCSCQIFESSYELLNCTTDSTFAIALEFFSENTPNQNVDIYLDGVYWGFYEADNLPLVVDNIPEGDGFVTLTICASDQNDCCDDIQVALIQCAGPQCDIYELFAETGDCTSDTTYLLDFVFEYSNLPTDSITVTANGEFIGQYEIDSVFNHIENFPVLTSNVVNLLVCAVGAPDCCEDFTYEAPNCDTFGQCQIFDLHVEVGECQSDSTYTLHLLFEYANLPSSSVVITANGQPYGVYHFNDGHIILENFPEFETNLTVISICSESAPDCCDVVEFETPQCGEPECEIWELHAIVEDCQSDSTYDLHLVFNFENLPTDSVAITANGNFIGNYQVNEGSLFLEDFPIYGTPNTTIQVCAVGAPDCCDVIEFDTPNCENGGTCHLYDLVADAIECQTDSTYYLFVHYFGNNFPVDSVIITANGQEIGTFPNDEDGFIIENFPEFNTDLTTITVCAVGNGECCDSFQFLTLNCGENNDCHIADLVADPGDCIGDSAYNLFVHYVAINLPTDSVVVSTNEETIIGTFAHNPDGFIIPNFPIWQGNHTVIRICAQGAPDCCAVIEIETPDCGQGVACHFHDLFAEHGPCTSDSTYVVDIVFELFNSPADSVLVFANDSLVGQYLIDPEFIHIENFPHLPGETTVITVCAVGAPDCCAEYILEVPSCGNCAIDITEVSVGECTSDSTFAAVIHIAYENIDAGGFDVWTGDVYQGFFTFEQLPVQINDFPTNETGNYVVTVCESDNAECCSSAEFVGPICPQEPCHIYDLVYTMTECDSNGHFYFILDFEFDNVGGEGYTVVGNGTNYGEFGYDNVPVVLGPFEESEINWEFLVQDISHPDCFDVVVPGVVTCEVATEVISPEDYFQVFNNGTIPGILAKKDVTISLFNGNGQAVYQNREVSTASYFELLRVPDGFYIATIRYAQYSWQVKLIRTGY